jgi:hypothetical protein
MQLVIKNGKVIATHDDNQNVAKLYPGCDVVTYAGTLIMPPTGELPDDPRTQAEKNGTYKDKRRQAYPNIEDQLDMIYWDKINNTTTWIDAITQVKNTIQNKIKS